MKKIITIVGARPQFVKAAVVSRALGKWGISEVIVHTGQHYDPNMSALFFEEMQIPIPKYNLEISNLSHGAMTGRMLEEIEKILIAEQPEMVLVYGDTNSTLAGALAASKLHIPVGHVEAGLRSFNNQMPEEINRILTDRIASVLFCPTTTAIENLRNEGFENFDCQVINCGDVMRDAALFYAGISDQHSTIISQLNLENQSFALATLHRQENTDNPVKLRNIFKALNEISGNTRVVLPIHPRTRKILMESGIQPSFELIDPVGYLDMIQLLKNCRIVLTDSGGLQKEAYFFKKYCITLRDETEWVELVGNGYNLLAGNDPSKILSAYQELLLKTSDFSVNLYGNGYAAEIIAEYLANL
ncbi:MAG: UDP-N-acetylglucosamine 2-epimerase (non-hydrolyzing) [Mariniphaga sp.]